MKFMHRYSRSKNSKSWKNCWPSFFWNLLIGSEEVTDTRFSIIYDPHILWRFIPDTLRGYWRRSLRSDPHHDTYWFVGTDVEPNSYFVDRTDKMHQFYRNVGLYTIKDTLKALGPNRVLPSLAPAVKPMMIPDVLCPWGCSEFAF